MQDWPAELNVSKVMDAAEGDDASSATEGDAKSADADAENAGKKADSQSESSAEKKSGDDF